MATLYADPFFLIMGCDTMKFDNYASSVFRHLLAPSSGCKPVNCTISCHIPGDPTLDSNSLIFLTMRR